MRTIRRMLLSMSFGALVAGTSIGVAQQQTFIYPAKGQSPAQQSRDEHECYGWAKQQTGYDPSRSVVQSPVQGGALPGAAKGAVVGVIGGAIAGNVGKGAAIGAGVGAMGGAIRKQSGINANAQAQQQALDNYNRAYFTCLEGRGYRVK